MHASFIYLFPLDIETNDDLKVNNSKLKSVHNQELHPHKSYPSE